MSEVVLGGDGRAVIHHTGTGQEMSCSVPTALENIANSGGVWAHGHRPVDLKVKEAAPVAAAEPAIELKDPDHLPLPAADPVRAPAPATPHPLDHDGDGKKGGSRKVPDPERVALFAALDAKGVKYFKGAKTDALKALLAG